MQKIKLMLLCCVTVYLSVNAQQHGRQIEVPAFTRLEVLGNFDVEIRKSENQGVQLKGSDNEIANVKVVVKGGVLRISNLKKAYEKKPEVQIIVNYSQLEKIVVSANAMLLTTAELSFDSIELVFSSGAKGDLKLNASKFNTTIDKGAILSIIGKVKTADIEAGSGGIFDGYEFKCDSAVVRANTGGIAKVYALKYLEASAAAGGEISYRGKPLQFKPRKTLGGKIEQLVE